MDPGLAIALSVLMHVTWNLLARQQPREVFALWWVLLGHLLILAPWGLWTLLTQVAWTPDFVALLITSALANATYFVALDQAYRHAPVALVYPLVRSSPLLIALVSVGFLGEALGLSDWLGLLVSASGLLLLARSAAGRGDRQALAWSSLAMSATCVYSLSDKAAVAAIDPLWGVIGYLSVGYATSWLALTLLLWRRERRWRPQRRLAWPLMLVGGLCVGLAYALVIHAMRQWPAAVVVTYTNAGIVLATLLSIAVFREREAWRSRLLAACVITAGLVGLGL